MQRILSSLIVIGTVFSVQVGAASQAVSIPDANLRAAIETALGKARGAPITEAEMASLTRLEAPNKNISDLTGLEYATGLTRLDLYSNELSGSLPSWLGNFTNLQWLSLGGNELSGSLPSWLGNLTNLQYLNLSGNELSGSLPSWLGNLTNLQLLYLGGNEFSGTLPSLGNLTNLRSLWLHFNQLSGSLPSWLGNLTNLQELRLNENQFSGSLPSWLGNLTNLRNLSLGGNELSGSLPSSLGNLTNLQELYLSGNELSGSLPSSLGNLTNLRNLWLDSNQFSGSLPSWLGNLTNLQELRLSHNQLSGTLPSSLGNLTNLQELYLHKNELSGSLPSSLGNLTNLQKLYLHKNELSGSLPSSLGNLTNLQVLVLNENEFSGSLPSSLGNLTNLQWLELLETQLCAPTDAAFQRWLEGIENKYGVRNCQGGPQRLTASQLSVREDAGPTEITLTVTLAAAAPADETVRFDFVAPSAGTPAERDVDYTAILPRLTIPAGATEGTANLTLSPIDNDRRDGNRGVGVRATASGGSTQTDITIIDDESLSTPSTNPDRAALVALYQATNGDNWTNNTNWLSDRPLGEWYGVTTDDDGRVTRLRLYDNGLSGELPAELGGLTNLQELILDSNELSGSLPSWLGNLTNLQWLSLSRNQLSGSLPSWLGNLTNLQWLWLYNNQLSGSLPSSLGNLTNLQWLWLYNNQLSGSLPSSLGNLTNLEELYLSGNEFSGSLPSWLGNLTNLEELGLSGNELSGSLPSWLGNLTNLEELYLSGNEFSGSLPSSLSNLTNLQFLNLTDTQLCAPTDAAFQRWLEGIENKYGVRNCGPADETPSTAIVLSVNPQTISEGADETEITVTATLDGRALSENTTVTLTIDPSSSTATRDVDYWAVLGSRLVIPAGSIAGETTLAVEAVADAEAEGNETIVLIGAVDGLTGDEVAITIIDDKTLSGGGGIKSTPKMYWADNFASKIQRANLDGTGVEDFITGLDRPTNLALDLGGGKIYWGTEGGRDRIQRANLDGTGIEDLVTAEGALGGLALDLGAGKIYWTDYYPAGKIQRANLDGTGVEDFITGLDRPTDLVLDLGGGKIYWTISWPTADQRPGKIQRANLDGTGIEDLVTEGVSDPNLALDMGADKMYWADWRIGKIQRANLDGTGIEDLITGLRPSNLALDVGAGKLYWTAPLPGKIQRANLDGTGIEDLITGLNNPLDIALDISGQSSLPRDGYEDPDFEFTVGEAIEPIVLPVLSAASVGGTPPYMYSVSGLPVGLSFDAATRTISGTPTEATNGPVTVIITVTDANGASASWPPLLITVNPSLPRDDQEDLDFEFTVGEAIEPTVLPVPTGGSPPYAYSVSGLPAGLSFDAATRTLSGTPTEATNGPIIVTYTVTDALGSSASLPLLITVNPLSSDLSSDSSDSPLAFAADTAVPNQSFTAGTAITPLVLPVASGGIPPYAYSVSNLPAGLSFDAATRTLSGTPTEATDSAVIVTYTVIDSGGAAAVLTFSITVNPSLSFGDLFGAGKVVPTHQHDLAEIREFIVGQRVEDVVLPKASGGSAPLRYSLSPALPAGLTFDAATRTIAGTPLAAGLTAYTYTVTDANGATASLSLQTLPTAFSLASNFPNPFNPTTTIEYALPQATDVALTVYNVVGQPVRTLVAEHQSAGRYAVEWDATDYSGHRLSSGLYFYRLQAGGEFVEVKKMLLLK